VTSPLVSIIVATRNRAEDLQQALASLIALRPRRAHCEFIVVDNGSSDRTPEVLQSFSSTEPRLRALHEPRLGVSHARNTGIAEARGSIIAFTDDDIVVHDDWIDSIVDAFATYPQAAAVGGRVLPQWPAPPPSWLRRQAWSPLAIVDYGPEPLVVDRALPLCLVAANLAVRPAVFQDVGLFSTAFPRGQDHEWLERLYAHGGFGVYVPGIVVSAPISPDRLKKQYHYRWHYRRGRYLARMRLPRLEATNTGRLFDVPGHMWRSCITEIVGVIRSTVLWQGAAAFDHFCVALYHAGFIRERTSGWVNAALFPARDATAR